MAGWKITRGTPSHTSLTGGITVGATLHPRSQAAAAKLSDALNAVGIKAMAMPMLLDDPHLTSPNVADPNSFRIFVIVGAKPDPNEWEGVPVSV